MVVQNGGLIYRLRLILKNFEIKLSNQISTFRPHVEFFFFIYYRYKADHKKTSKEITLPSTFVNTQYKINRFSCKV